MNYTEDDTFRLLKRTPYDEMLPKVISLYATWRTFSLKDSVINHDVVGIKFNWVLSEYGWSLEEFENEYQSRIK